MKKDLLPLGGTAGAGHPLRVQGRRKLRMPIRSLVCSVSQKCFIAGLGRLIHGVALALAMTISAQAAGDPQKGQQVFNSATRWLRRYQERASTRRSDRVPQIGNPVLAVATILAAYSFVGTYTHVQRPLAAIAITIDWLFGRSCRHASLAVAACCGRGKQAPGSGNRRSVNDLSCTRKR